MRPTRSPQTAVLIVDGSPFSGELASRLKAAGVVAALAREPGAAERYLRNLRFDVVLVDVDADLEAAQRLLAEVARCQPAARRIATGCDGVRAPGLPFLRKPFELDAILGSLG